MSHIIAALLTCGKCGGRGKDTWEEDGRTVTDVCYHCAGSGRIDEETAHHDRMMRIGGELAYLHVQGMIKSRNEDPEGEGWAFCAAENMLSERDYTMATTDDFAYTFAEKLSSLPHNLQVLLADTLEAKWANDLKVREAKKAEPKVAAYTIVTQIVVESESDEIPF